MDTGVAARFGEGEELLVTGLGELCTSRDREGEEDEEAVGEAVGLANFGAVFVRLSLLGAAAGRPERGEGDTLEEGVGEEDEP